MSSQLGGQPCARSQRAPSRAFAVGFGTTRRVNWDATTSVEDVRCSVPHHLVDLRVWARFHGDELIVTAVAETGPVEIARHARSTPGHLALRDEHRARFGPRTGCLKPQQPEPDACLRKRLRPLPWTSCTVPPASMRRVQATAVSRVVLGSGCERCQRCWSWVIMWSVMGSVTWE
ncbi:Mu transposase domain-containing protein [Saccharopolyspora rosea]|uniref:Mu transposase domain-containing protein n=1 Tax=Saccharopolyspora rosea TaxID=524884 RepID=UPI0037C702DB